MPHRTNPPAVWLSALGLAAILHAPLWSAPPTPSTETLIDVDQTILGQAFAYPQGRARITAAVVTVPPGASLPEHRHPVPVFGYVLAGELVVDYGPEGTRTYRKGETLIEAIDWPHRGRNEGRRKVEILVVYAGADGVENTVLESAGEGTVGEGTVGDPRR